jgi:anti-anti-sigma regulatory factor
MHLSKTDDLGTLDTKEGCFYAGSYLGLAKINEHYQDLAAGLSSSKPNDFVIDVSEIVQMSLAHFQVFLSLFRTLDEKKVEYKLLAPSEVFLNIFKELGVSDEEINNLILTKVCND